jgi:Lar family restriction alleviation protein
MPDVDKLVTAQEAVELKPCPFCGSHSAEVVRNGSGTTFYGHCFFCGADGPLSGTKKAARDGWNRRAQEAPHA